MSLTSGYPHFFNLWVSFLVEVGVNLTNPVDRVSLSLWTGRAVIQVFGCGHPWSWKDAVEGRTAWVELQQYGRGRCSGFWYIWRRWFWWLRWYSWWYFYYISFLGSPCQQFLRYLTSACPIACYIVSFSSSCAPNSWMMKGDTYIGRGCKQRGLPRSVFGNPYKLCNHSRSQAVVKYRQLLDDSPELSSQLINLSGRRLLCHCKRFQQCHADATIAKFAELYPGAYDRDRAAERVPTSEELNLMATVREDPSSDEGSTADEGVPDRGSGWVGSGPPMRVGVGYTARDMCDGQGLPSPGRWPIASRRYPASPIWKAVPRKFEQFSAQYGTAELLMNLALGRIQENPFSEKEIQDRKQDVIDELEPAGLELKREENDRRDVPIDFRYLDLLLKAAEDPEVGLEQFSQRVRVGPSARMPRLPALYKPKRMWRLPAQTDPSNYRRSHAGGSNYPSLSEHTERVKKMLEDQTSRGQLIKLHEDEAKARYPNLVIASLGANRKDKPNGEISARFRWHQRTTSEHADQVARPGAVTDCGRPEACDA